MLAMLELLVAVTLDALEQGGQGELLLVAQLGLLLLDDGLHLKAHNTIRDDAVIVTHFQIGPS